MLEIDFLDYINGNILSQPNNNSLLHFVAFYNKNLDFAKCNYNIYNKKFLVIICTLEKWQLKLKNTEIPIQIFINYKNFEYFQFNKKLFCYQSRWIKILFHYNFIIIYYSGKQNIKVDAFTRHSNEQPAYILDKYKLFYY